MREQHLHPWQRRSRRRTTRPGQGRWRVADRIRCKSADDGLNHRWYGAEIATGEGKLFLASVLDMGSRRIVCWHRRSLFVAGGS